jgi:twitching motility protein PilT
MLLDGMPEPRLHINMILKHALEVDASDCYLRTGLPPMLKKGGKLQPVPGTPRLSPEMVADLVYQMANEQRRAELDQERELDFAYAIPGGRFRVNVLWEQGRIASVLRTIPDVVPTMDEINLPPQARAISDFPRGLVLVTGPTGSGKSTTLASILRAINETRPGVIVTIEDPIEFVHPPAKCLILQREVGEDTMSFSNALRAALREAPDVILVGEMRDLETIETAITAAETGHLVFATLHTQSAPATINRLIDAFPSGQQAQIRAQLSVTLQAIVSQVLLPRVEGGRAAAHEVLVVDNAVRNMIREGKIEQMRSTMQTGYSRGHQTLDRSLGLLARQGIVDPVVAKGYSQDENEFDRVYRSADSITDGGASVSEESGGRRSLRRQKKDG